MTVETEPTPNSVVLTAVPTNEVDVNSMLGAAFAAGNDQSAEVEDTKNEPSLDPGLRKLRIELDAQRRGGSMILAATNDDTALELSNKLRHETDIALFGQMESGDPDARNEIVERFLPLARTIARRYARTTEPFEDLIQVASLALVKAVDRFDLSRGTDFRNYASSTIKGEIKNHFRDRIWGMHVDRGLKDLSLEVMKVQDKMERKRQDSSRPTPEEIALELDEDEDRVLKALLVLHQNAYSPNSLNELSGDDENDGQALIDRVSDRRSEVEYALARRRVDLAAAVVSLPPNLQEVINGKLEGLEQAQIAQRLGVTQQTVSRWLRKATIQLTALLVP